PPEVDAHRALDVLERRLEDRAPLLDGGVVDQDVETPVPRDDVVDDLPHAGGVGDVERHDLGAGRDRSERGEQLAERVDSARDADDHRAAPREVEAQLASDPHRGAGDERDLAVQVHPRVLSYKASGGTTPGKTGAASALFFLDSP